ncbi:hypothetical protein HPB52_003122 [Rhipicephalus sanguineus]|uniref:Uncharacterized protein n=1 Tax=Rhipicephalus sanguineus TaxID=34632 RepID=A0A9D4PRD6_RHISA|nr:hypothetical protein HPB52_003122 [Rhipicephalus sanguineus]
MTAFTEGLRIEKAVYRHGMIFGSSSLTAFLASIVERLYQLDATLAINGIKGQKTMHAILLDALPAELRHLSATSSSNPQPYEDLCDAVLARYDETYHPLPETPVPPGTQPSHDRDLTSPASCPSTFRPASSAAVPAPDHRPDEVENVAAAVDQSATSTSVPQFSRRLPRRTPWRPPRPQPTSCPLFAHPSEVLPSTIFERDLPSNSKLCASCQQRSASPSMSTAAEVRAPYQLRPHLRDAATMAEAPEDDMPAGSPMAERATHVTPAQSAGIQHPNPREPSYATCRGCFNVHRCTIPTCRDYACSVSPQICSRDLDAGRRPSDMWSLCRCAVQASSAHLQPTVCAAIASRAADDARGVRLAVTGIVVACATPFLIRSRLSEIGSDMHKVGRTCYCQQRLFVATLARYVAPRAARQRPDGSR